MIGVDLYLIIGFAVYLTILDYILYSYTVKKFKVLSKNITGLSQNISGIKQSITEEKAVKQKSIPLLEEAENIEREEQPENIDNELWSSIGGRVSPEVAQHLSKKERPKPPKPD